jgi:hypothetical protein
MRVNDALGNLTRIDWRVRALEAGDENAGGVAKEALEIERNGARRRHEKILPEQVTSDQLGSDRQREKTFSRAIRDGGAPWPSEIPTTKT